MFYSISRLLNNKKSYLYNQISRTIYTTKHLRYDVEGKSTIHILNNEADMGLMINGYSQAGFRLNNQLTVLGPMAIFPKSVLSWNIKDVNDITEESLCLFTVLQPKVELLVLGIGDKPDDLSIYKKFLSISRNLKISFEILPTEQACATFNFLNSESRYIAGAMIPPEHIKTTDDDVLTSKLRYERLYETDDPKLL